MFQGIPGYSFKPVTVCLQRKMLLSHLASNNCIEKSDVYIYVYIYECPFADVCRILQILQISLEECFDSAILYNLLTVSCLSEKQFGRRRRPLSLSLVVARRPSCLQLQHQNPQQLVLPWIALVQLVQCGSLFCTSVKRMR